MSSSYPSIYQSLPVVVVAAGFCFGCERSHLTCLSLVTAVVQLHCASCVTRSLQGVCSLLFVEGSGCACLLAWQQLLCVQLEATG